MKLNLLLLLLFFLSASISSAYSNTDKVHDISNHTLRRGHEYYILPAIRGRSGGLALSHRNTTICPLYVAQEVLEISNGFPLTFSPVNPKKKDVRLSTDLNVEFSGATICVTSLVWKLSGVDVASEVRRYVSIGGVKGNPGPATLSNWFKIERYGDGTNYYKIVFCPTVCNFCKVVCGDLGIFVEDQRIFLGLSDVAFPVVFKEVTE